jgi:hypothetical protein
MSTSTSTPLVMEMSGYRTAPLYSQSNLPADVAIEIDINSKLNMNISILQKMANNPQIGASVPQAFKDTNVTTVPDKDAV